jgi:threonine dehydrogenase-like Zn-dependent dehydrogenase
LIAYLLKRHYGFVKVGVVDRDAFRMGKAKQVGADVTAASTAEAVEAVGQFGCAVDAVGVGAVLTDALTTLRHGGYLYISAIYEKLPIVDVNCLVSKELTVIGNNAYTFEDMVEAAEMISSGKLDLSWLVTRVLPALDAHDAFKLLTNQDKIDLKILLKFHDAVHTL